MKKNIVILTLVLLLSGCQVMRENTAIGQSEVNSTTQGLLIGCLTGGIVDDLINKGKGAALGCEEAGGAGALVGYRMDEQESMLRQSLLSTGIKLERVGNKIKLIMPGDITFKSGRTQLSDDIKPVLNNIANIVGEYDVTSLIVSGHTDSIGTYEENDRLSIIRAISVEIYLRDQGLSKYRMSANGFGETQPICTNMYKKGRACNRRVEIDIILE